MAIEVDAHVQAPVTTAIRAQDVRKSYRVGDGEVEILHGVSLSVSTGEMVAIMGPSGSGKSTLMYCLAGLEAPSSGTVSIAEQPLAGLSRTALAKMRRSQVGFVFQSYNLIPTLTAAENVALPYMLARRKPPAGLIENTLTTVGLSERMNAQPPSMSGGEQQRVALARVLAQQPDVIFADEPTGALDTRTGELVLAELSQIAHTPGRSVLVVTHDPTVAAACDRIFFMRDGLLVKELASASAEQVAATLTGLSAHEAG
ncbi:ABC transporter ATP-binding protein [Tessaracoccus caeni]|uniref:ABC transporter ATP-binding protein n=1 Tax=Tessaracoccus caeni TaxID=3031239 RepID=UPI0023D97E94|nr:ABC transporter ATP-binding protein [Tessaracoccus caeni]MDF1487176.1 ABC transporter ATP-binding protein [Tessaracoccus caeni]